MRHLIGLSAVFLLLGCSGNYTIGNGRFQQTDAGEKGGDNGSGGGSAGGKIGMSGSPGNGGVTGGGGVGKGGAPGGECTSPADCSVPQVCQVCPNGSYSCAKGDCVGGKCQTFFDSCGGVGT